MTGLPPAKAGGLAQSGATIKVVKRTCLNAHESTHDSQSHRLKPVVFTKCVDNKKSMWPYLINLKLRETNMFCANCGKEILVETKFCAYCGVPVESVFLQATQKIASKTETSALRAAYNSAGQSVNRATSTAGNIVSTVAMQVGDLNGDGKIDAEDFKIAAARAKGFAVAATDEAAKLGRDALQSDLVKDAAAGAAVGAVVAIPIPLIGPIGGAAVGAILGAYKNVTKK